MRRKDYSADAELLNIESLDGDSLEETGINAGRMRLPTMYDISKWYRRSRANRKAHRKGEYGQWLKKGKEGLPDISSDFDWQITYSFPQAVRDNAAPRGTYGSRSMTFRRLYLILCERFNGGAYFIDEYFDTVYEYTVKPVIDGKLEKVKSELLEVADMMLSEADMLNEEEGLEGMRVTRKGALDRRYKKRNRNAARALSDYSAFAKEWEASEGSEAADIIREDIISCITSGQLPCQFRKPSSITMERRARAGLAGVPLFSATERLARSLQLQVRIGGNGKWQTQSGILV